MADDEEKVVDLKSHKRAKRAKVDDQTMNRTWQALGNVWLTYAAEVKSKEVEGELCLSGEPSAVFCVLLENLVAMAQAMKVENDKILDLLLGSALIQCEPKGRLHQLLHKASNLLEDGDEDSMEKALRKLHARGDLTDEQLAHELAIPVTKETAMERLFVAGHGKVSAELEGFRSVDGDDKGWDGWFRGEFPDLVTVVWP